jgi:hypothetical protein
MCSFQDDGKIKKEKKIYHHGPRPVPIEEGRPMRMVGTASQEVTKIIRNGAASNQLTDVGRGGESVGGDSEPVDV